MNKLKLAYFGLALNIVFWLAILVYKGVTVGNVFADLIFVVEMAIYVGFYFGIRAKKKIFYALTFVVTGLNMLAGFADIIGPFEITYFFIGFITFALLILARESFSKKK